MIIQHNMLAMNAMRSLGIMNNNQAKKTEKLSSGYRINRAADDAAGLAISEKMRWMIRGLAQGTKNTQDGISFVQIGDGAMGEIHDMIHRMEELSVKAANGTLDDNDRSMIDSEIQQLKEQINSIGRHTVFNELPIFDNSSFLNVTGTPNDMSFFNAQYDDATGEFSYGGFLLNGYRVKWSDVDADMIDPATGLFTGGTYQITKAGTTFSIRTEEGSSVPSGITRTMSVSVDNSGVLVDGTRIPLANLKDEKGVSASASNFHSGAWVCDYKGCELSFFVQEEVHSLSELTNALNKITNNTSLVHYVWEETYAGEDPKQAVDVNQINKVRVSQATAATLVANPTLEFVVHADEDGVSLCDAGGTELAGSKKTWNEMNILSWDSGNTVASSRNYYYTYSDSVGALVSFRFKLADETSKDSVIDGLDGMHINCSNVSNSYITSVSNPTSNLNVNASANIHVSLAEEYDLGRDFDMEEYVLGNESMQYDASAQKATVQFANGGTPVISLTGSTTTAENTLTNKINDYFDTYGAILKQSTILGDPVIPQTLVDVVGASNITSSGYFSGNVTLTDDMVKTTTSPGSTGRTYPTAEINFQNLTTANDIKKLIGTGFDSTCKTCSEHYSILFSDTFSSGAYSTTAEGYRFRVSQSGNNNKKLEIDINSLVDNGVDNASKLAEAFVKIASGNFDQHYTQYAAKNGRLYIYDNRAQNTPAPEADFWTAPLESDTAVNTSVLLTDDSGDGGRIQLNINYDLTNIASKVVIDETLSAGGQYVRNADLHGDPSMTGYAVYNDATMGGLGLNRYDLDVAYLDANGTKTTKAAAAASNAQRLVQDSIQNSSVKLQSTQYTTMKATANELPNTEMKPFFTSQVRREGEPELIYIVHSAMPKDRTGIPRFPMTTAAMSISSTNVKTIDNALKALDQLKLANEYVSEKRSTYGALQNRMEHTIRNNQNKEENMTAAESRIRDTDMAETVMQYSNNQILVQAGQAMLAQANQSKQGVLSLLS